MDEPKVLVAAPTYSGKHYIFPRWYQLITNLTYKNYDYLVVDNSRGRSYSTKLRRQGYHKIVHIPRGKHARQALANSAEYIRSYALENGFDYIMMIETDLLPPRDVIERLIKHKKDIVGGIYEIGLHGSKNAPRKMCLYGYHDNSDNENDLIRMMDIEEGYKYVNTGLRQVAAMGLGCTLMHKNIFERFSFKYSERHAIQSDVILYLELAQNHVPVYADTDLIVPHFNQNWVHVKDR